MNVVVVRVLRDDPVQLLVAHVRRHRGAPGSADQHRLPPRATFGLTLGIRAGYSTQVGRIEHARFFDDLLLVVAGALWIARAEVRRARTAAVTDLRSVERPGTMIQAASR
jgi:hypothetical protein